MVTNKEKEGKKEMKVIYKQNLEEVGEQIIELPQDNKLLHVGVQYNKLRLWYECYTSPKIKVKIYIYGTGDTIEEKNLKYLGTVQMYSGSLVLHVYEGEIV